MVGSKFIFFGAKITSISETKKIPCTVIQIVTTVHTEHLFHCPNGMINDQFTTQKKKF